MGKQKVKATQEGKQWRIHHGNHGRSEVEYGPQAENRLKETTDVPRDPPNEEWVTIARHWCVTFEMEGDKYTVVGLVSGWYKRSQYHKNKGR